MTFFRWFFLIFLTLTLCTAVVEAGTPRYQPGDIIYDRPTNGDPLWIILEFDPITDEYEMDLINKFDSGSWGYRFDYNTDWYTRSFVEEYYGTLITHVSLQEVKVGYPGLPAPTPIITVPPTTPIPQPSRSISGPTYHPGDIVYDRPTNGNLAWLVLEYDSFTDEYEMDTILRCDDRHWGYRIDYQTDWYRRTFIDEYDDVLLARVNLAEVTVGYPGLPAPTPIITVQPTTPLPQVTPVGITPIYRAGDVVSSYWTNANSALVILGYDSRTDEYEMDTIFRYDNRAWGYRYDSSSWWSLRSVTQNIYPVLLARLIMEDVPIGSQTPTYTPTPTSEPMPDILIVPGSTRKPTDLNKDGKYEDVNGNERPDFADVVLYFNQMTWIGVNEPLSAFDFNNNDRIDFADVVWLFNNL